MVISTDTDWLAASSCSWCPSTGGAESLLRDAELPELPLSGTPGSTFLTPGLMSLGSAVAAPRGFVPTVACGKRGCLQKQELYVRSPRESMKSLLCLKWNPFKPCSSGTQVGKPCQSLCWICTEQAVLGQGISLVCKNLFTGCEEMILLPQMPVLCLGYFQLSFVTVKSVFFKNSIRMSAGASRMCQSKPARPLCSKKALEMDGKSEGRNYTLHPMHLDCVYQVL